MTTELPPPALFPAPDRGLLENVVLRHDNGGITSISRARRPHPDRARSGSAFVNAHDHARPTASSFGAIGMPLESESCARRWARRSIPI